VTVPEMLYPSCPKCEGVMAEGYLLEESYHGAPSTVKYVDGPPKVSKWIGLRVDKKQAIPVATYRCLDCGYLESYARKQPG